MHDTPLRSGLSVLMIFGHLLCSFSLKAQSSEEAGQSGFAYHAHKGFSWKTKDGNYQLQIASRFQFRFAFPGDQDPLTLDDFEADKQVIFKINRARLKVGGHAYRPWLKYYWEYELGQGNLLDFRIMIEKWPWLSFKVGQWKTEYGRERVISSGAQQMIERSLINRPFTIDRQQGVAVYGHLKGNGIADFNYWVSILNGMGRGARTNDDKHLMYEGRLQWNILGRQVEMSGADPEISAKPVAMIACAGVTNISPYTRFSQSGGGELEGYDDGIPGQYKVNQLMFETAFKYQGFSWQHETHFKEIQDLANQTTTHLRGSYGQFGFFPHVFAKWAPPYLEWAFRYASYRPNTQALENRQREFSTVFNYYFSGHLNKLSAEVAYLHFASTAFDQAEGLRLRIQWDISF